MSNTSQSEMTVQKKCKGRWPNPSMQCTPVISARSYRHPVLTINVACSIGTDFTNYSHPSMRHNIPGSQVFIVGNPSQPFIVKKSRAGSFHSSLDTRRTLLRCCHASQCKRTQTLQPRCYNVSGRQAASPVSILHDEVQCC